MLSAKFCIEWEIENLLKFLNLLKNDSFCTNLQDLSKFC